MLPPGKTVPDTPSAGRRKLSGWGGAGKEIPRHAAVQERVVERCAPPSALPGGRIPGPQESRNSRALFPV